MTVATPALKLGPLLPVRDWCYIGMIVLICAVGVWGLLALPTDGSVEVRSLKARVVALEDAQAKQARENADVKALAGESERWSRETTANITALRGELHREWAARKERR